MSMEYWQQKWGMLSRRKAAEKIFGSQVKRGVHAGKTLFTLLGLMMSNDASFPLVLEALPKIRGYSLKEPRKLVFLESDAGKALL